jgi:YD repeat-containing protein
MTERIILLWALILSFVTDIQAQQMPVKNVPSPEIADLGEYGKVPVSLYTGIPDISIPLCDLTAGEYKLPISASYHLSSVRPNSQSGCLGLGWSLIAGGYITRTVRNIYDEKCDKEGNKYGYYYHAAKLDSLSSEEFLAVSADPYTYKYELTADEFTFSFCGYSGSFYYGPDEKWHVVSDQDIAVEFNPVLGEGFIDLKQLSERIDVGDWTNRSMNNRFFNKFTLVTPDGCRYEFGGINATEYSVSYYNRNNSDLIPTTWRLSGITTADGRNIEFTYDTTSIMCDIRYVPQKRVIVNCKYCNDRTINQTGLAGMTGYLLFPVNLKEIRTPNETLMFNYYDDYGYGSRFVNEFLAWGNDSGLIYGREENDGYVTLDDYSQFGIFLGGVKYTDSPSIRKEIRQKLSRKILHSIYVKDEKLMPLHTIYFGYSTCGGNRLKLSLITERKGNPDTEYVYETDTDAGKTFVASCNIPANNSGCSVPEYRFNYHSSVSMPSNYVRPTVDSWGYYNGGTVSISSEPDYNIHNGSLTYILADVLTDVTYPTGGTSSFEYEMNDYSQVVSEDRMSLKSQTGSAAGLRIKSVTNKDESGNVIYATRYYYSEKRGGKSSGILKAPAVNNERYVATDSNASMTVTSAGGLFPSLTNMNTPDIGYSSVIEETQNADGKSQGYILRKYSNYDSDIYGKSHFDEAPAVSTFTGSSYTQTYSSRSYERGKLLSEEFYDSDNRLCKSTRYTYSDVAPDSIKTASQTTLIFCHELVYQEYAGVGSLIKTYTTSSMPDSVVEKIYPSGADTRFSSQVTNSYNNYKLLYARSEVNSDGKVITKAYQYAAERPEYEWMKNSHILTPIYSMTDSTGESSHGEYYTYNDGPVPYIKSYATRRNSYEHTNCTVEETDSYGNPLSLTEENMPVVMIRADKGQRLVARIENATLKQVECSLGMTIKNMAELDVSDSSFRQLEPLRNQLQSAHFYIYRYDAEKRLQSVTTPDGNTEYYEYDFLGRLTQKYIMDMSGGISRKRILNVYGYNYQQCNTSQEE